MRVYFFSAQSYEEEYFDRHKNHHQFIYYQESLKTHTSSLAQGAEAVCVFVNDELNESCVANLSKQGIRYIVLRCAGFNNVDIQACQKYNIKVARVPAYSPHSVAEHTMAMLLTLVRKTHKAYNRVRDGNFSLQGLEGITLAGKTVGIVGLGKIGTVFANICLGFGCHVQIYDPDKVSLADVQQVSFDQLIQTSDFISLHCPLTDKTFHLIDKIQFARMKKNVILINTGRGALINAKDLINALKKRKIAGVCLDVYEQESGLFFSDLSETIIADDVLMRLTTFPNVLITSHQGFFTRESLEEIARITISNLNQFESQQSCNNEII